MQGCKNLTLLLFIPLGPPHWTTVKRYSLCLSNYPIMHAGLKQNGFPYLKTQSLPDYSIHKTDQQTQNVFNHISFFSVKIILRCKTDVTVVHLLIMRVAEGLDTLLFKQPKSLSCWASQFQNPVVMQDGLQAQWFLCPFHYLMMVICNKDKSCNFKMLMRR